MCRTDHGTGLRSEIRMKNQFIYVSAINPLLNQSPLIVPHNIADLKQLCIFFAEIHHKLSESPQKIHAVK